MRKQMVFRSMVISSLVLALIALFAPWAMADDATDEVDIKVESVLEAVDCLALPPRITVLGLNIDISKARLKGDDHDDDDGDDDDDDYLHKHNDDDTITCGDLVPGQLVEVKLANDLLDPTTGLLSATEVEVEENECEDEEVKVEGPIQAVDQALQTVTVLGLVIDISQAELKRDEGDNDDHDEAKLARASHSYDDDDYDCDDPPVDISQLIVGQFVEIKLVSSQAPLVATEVEIKNFDNEVDVDVDDDDGDVQDDVEVDVAVTVAVKKATRNGVKTVKKVVKFHTVGSGGASLRGLPTGKAKIVVTRIKDGRKSVGKSAVKVESNSSKQVRVRLKKAK